MTFYQENSIICCSERIRARVARLRRVLFEAAEGPPPSTPIVCVGGFFVFIMAAASYFFLLDEARFRRFAPISRGLLRDSSTSRVELAQVYMTMMAFCLVHAAAFFMIAVFSYKLRTTHS
ncbi:hypothetical protein Y032_0143g2421 [Ancylostoma ceylanicum]|uniref:Uncharacterized protein n=1 Tax=Ancylostoma ceylanicum TaxID=53326 RepID=A0A016T2F9_9BILA|nr:hypothetical protein Y032_0143g2421 [Ancylostoma ceylanicum]